MSNKKRKYSSNEVPNKTINNISKNLEKTYSRKPKSNIDNNIIMTMNTNIIFKMDEMMGEIKNLHSQINNLNDRIVSQNDEINLLNSKLSINNKEKTNTKDNYQEISYIS